MYRTSLTLALCGALAACSGTAPDVAKFAARGSIETHTDGPPDAAPGTCWALDRTPAKVERTTEKVLVRPGDYAHDGIVLREAVYETKTEEKIREEGKTLWFQTPCDVDMTTDFIASLQRALSARDLYSGDISGVLDTGTKRAIRQYQLTQGLNSQVLSLAAAEQLGLVAVSAARELTAEAEPEPTPLATEVTARTPLDPTVALSRPVEAETDPVAPISEDRSLENSVY